MLLLTTLGEDIVRFGSSVGRPQKKNLSPLPLSLLINDVLVVVGTLRSTGQV